MKNTTGVRRLLIITAVAAASLSMACVAQAKGATVGNPASSAQAESLDVAASPGPGLGPTPEGVLPAVPQPKMPEKIPGYTELDPETGLHMTGTPVLVDLASYRLKVTGLVEKELDLSYDDLRRLPRAGSRPLLVCEGFFADTANWAGASLAALLDRAGLRPSATRLALTSADDYTITIGLKEALADGGFLAYELEGKPIPVIHGFPVRAVFPSQSGYMWAKWLVAIRVE
jgi:DMSO/TMAO reductase YedYZ molybdopterin-dependent catalytic subunit